MVNLQRFLLSLLPVIGDQPAPVFLAPEFAAAVSSDGGIDDFLHAIYVAEETRHQGPCTLGRLNFKKIEVMWHILLISVTVARLTASRSGQTS